MSDSDLVKLYSGRILELAADMPLTGRLPHPDGTAKKRSPLCGSTVTVDLTLDGDRIAGTVGFPLPGVEVRIAEADSGKVLPQGESWRVVQFALKLEF